MANDRKRNGLFTRILITLLLVGAASLWSLEQAQADPPPAPCPSELPDC